MFASTAANKKGLPRINFKEKNNEDANKDAKDWYEVREQLNSARSFHATNSERVFTDQEIRQARELRASKVAKMGLLRMTSIQVACPEGTMVDPSLNFASRNHMTSSDSPRLPASTHKDRSRFTKASLVLMCGWERHELPEAPVKIEQVSWGAESRQLLVHESMFRWPLKLELWGQRPGRQPPQRRRRGGHLVGTGRMAPRAFLGRPGEWVNARVPLYSPEGDPAGEAFLQVHFAWLADIGAWEGGGGGGGGASSGFFPPSPPGRGSVLSLAQTVRSALSYREEDFPNKLTVWNVKATDLPWPLVERGASAFVRLRLGWAEASTQTSAFAAGQQVWRWQGHPTVPAEPAELLKLPFADGPEFDGYTLEAELWAEQPGEGSTERLLGVGALQLRSLLEFPVGDALRLELALRKGGGDGGGGAGEGRGEVGALLELWARCHLGLGTQRNGEDTHSIVTEGALAHSESKRRLAGGKADAAAQTPLSVAPRAGAAAAGGGGGPGAEGERAAAAVLRLGGLFVMGLPPLDKEEERGYLSLDPYLLVRCGGRWAKTEIVVNAGADVHWATALRLPLTEEALAGGHLALELWSDRDPLPDRLIGCGRVGVADALASCRANGPGPGAGACAEVRLHTPQGKWGGVLRLEASLLPPDAPPTPDGYSARGNGNGGGGGGGGGGGEGDAGELGAGGHQHRRTVSTPGYTSASDLAMEGIAPGGEIGGRAAAAAARSLPRDPPPPAALLAGALSLSSTGWETSPAGPHRRLALLALARLALGSPAGLRRARAAADPAALLRALRDPGGAAGGGGRRVAAGLVALLAAGAPDFQRQLSSSGPGFRYQNSWVFSIPQVLFEHYTQMKQSTETVYEVETSDGEILRISSDRISSRKEPVSLNPTLQSYRIGEEVFIRPHMLKQNLHDQKYRNNYRQAYVVQVYPPEQPLLPNPDFYQHLQDMLSEQAPGGLAPSRAAGASVGFLRWPPGPAAAAAGRIGEEDAAAALMAEMPDPQTTLLAFELVPSALEGKAHSDRESEVHNSFSGHEDGRRRTSSASSAPPRRVAAAAASPSLGDGGGGPPAAALLGAGRVRRAFAALQGPANRAAAGEKAEVLVTWIQDDPTFKELWTARGTANLSKFLKGRPTASLRDLLRYNTFVQARTTATTTRPSSAPHSGRSPGGGGGQVASVVVYRGDAVLPAWRADEEGLALAPLPPAAFPAKHVALTFSADPGADALVLCARAPDGWAFSARAGRSELARLLGRPLPAAGRNHGGGGGGGGPSPALLGLRAEELRALAGRLALPGPGEAAGAAGALGWAAPAPADDGLADDKGMILMKLVASPDNGEDIPSFSPGSTSMNGREGSIPQKPGLSPLDRADKMLAAAARALLGALEAQSARAPPPPPPPGAGAAAAAAGEGSPRARRSRHDQNQDRLADLQEGVMHCIRIFNFYLQARNQERQQQAWWANPATNQQSTTEPNSGAWPGNDHHNALRALRRLEPRTPPGGAARPRRRRRQPEGGGPAEAFALEDGPPSSDLPGSPESVEKSKQAERRLQKIEGIARAARDELTKGLKASKLAAYRGQAGVGARRLAARGDAALGLLGPALLRAAAGGGGGRGGDPAAGLGSPHSLGSRVSGFLSSRRESAAGEEDPPAAHRRRGEGGFGRRRGGGEEEEEEEEGYRVVLGDSVEDDHVATAPRGGRRRRRRGGAAQGGSPSKADELRVNRKLARESLRQVMEREARVRATLRRRVADKAARVEAMEAQRRAAQQQLATERERENRTGTKLTTEKKRSQKTKKPTAKSAEMQQWYEARDDYRQQRQEQHQLHQQQQQGRQPSQMSYTYSM